MKKIVSAIIIGAFLIGCSTATKTQNQTAPSKMNIKTDKTIMGGDEIKEGGSCSVVQVEEQSCN